MSVVGRNDPCPCGSGLKFKKCCLNKPARSAPTYSSAERDSALVKLMRFTARDEFDEKHKAALALFWGDWLAEEPDDALDAVIKSKTADLSTGKARFARWWIATMSSTTATAAMSGSNHYRKWLDQTFAACGAVSDANASHADSGAELRELLAGNNRYVFTLIHKFQPEKPRTGTPSPHPSPTGRGTESEGILPVLCDRHDVIVLTDEAHRTKYDTLALNMRSALPNALFMAFTGTPLIAGEERTREVFGDYMSIYDFQQSVEDARRCRSSMRTGRVI